MHGKAILLQALEELEALQRQSRVLPFERRTEILAIRRQIAEQNVKIATIGDEVFCTIQGQAAFRRELTKLRAAIASHMAAWPVVKIDHEDPEYIASLSQHRTAYHNFLTWVRREHV